MQTSKAFAIWKDKDLQSQIRIISDSHFPVLGLTHKLL